MESVGARVFRFGAFELDVRAGELRKHGTKIRLQEQPLRILLILLEHPGQVVLREEIRKRLWPNDTIVEFDHSINAAIKRLRDALGDSAASPRYVETVDRRGYRFLGEVATVPNAVAPKNPRPASIVVVCFLILGTVISLFFALRHSPPLTDKDTIVLAGFTNTTGDPVFDDTLRQGLAIQLEQSPFLSLDSEERIRQTLRLMGQPDAAKLSPEIARDLCQRIGSAALIDGSIAKLGSQYVVGLKATACRNGDLLAQQQEIAPNKESVLRTLGNAAAKLRPKLGESLRTVQKFDTPLEEATTSSLEALQAYSLGQKILKTQSSADGIPALQRAIRLDPNFAMAYAILGDQYWNLHETKLAQENVAKAYQLRGRVSENEKFFIEADYYATVTGDREAARRVFQLWSNTYPRSYNLNDLGYLYNELGEHEKALDQKMQALRRSPENPSAYSSAGFSLLCLNRFEEVRAIAQQAQGKNLDSSELHWLLYYLAFLDNNDAAMAQHVAWLAGKAQEFTILDIEASTAAYFGRMAKSRELMRRAVDGAEREGLKELAAAIENAAAAREALFGNPREAKECVRNHGDRDSAGTALALALAGNTEKAESLASDLARRSPENTEIRFCTVPTIRAQIALCQGHPTKAIEQLQATRPYELGTMGFSLYAAYLRGSAYLSAKQGAQAAAEFQKLLDHRGLLVNDPIAALAHLQLGRTLSLSGDHAAAQVAYRDFLNLWKDADPDIPILRAAKTEYASLGKGA